MRLRNIPSGIIGAWANYWIPSSLQESVNKKLDLNSKLPTYSSSVNALYTAGGKALVGISLIKNSTISLDDPKFVLGTIALCSSAFSVVESYYRTKLATEHDKPIPGLIIYGLENLLDKHDDKLLFIAQNNKAYVNRI